MIKISQIVDNWFFINENIFYKLKITTKKSAEIFQFTCSAPLQVWPLYTFTLKLLKEMKHLCMKKCFHVHVTPAKSEHFCFSRDSVNDAIQDHFYTFNSSPSSTCHTHFTWNLAGFHLSRCMEVFFLKGNTVLAKFKHDVKTWCKDWTFLWVLC